MAEMYTPLFTPPEKRDEPALWFAFRKSEIIVVNGGGRPDLPCCVDLSEHGVSAERHQYLGLYDGKHCYAVAIHESQALPGDWNPHLSRVTTGAKPP